MDDLRVFLRDAGALVLSPLLVPGVRPLTKAALKGGMAVADVAKDAAESTGKQLREVCDRGARRIEEGAATGCGRTGAGRCATGDRRRRSGGG